MVHYPAVVAPRSMEWWVWTANRLRFVLRGSRKLCRVCLAENLNASIDDVDAGCQALLVPRKSARCDNCLKHTVVHSLP